MGAHAKEDALSAKMVHMEWHTKTNNNMTNPTNLELQVSESVILIVVIFIIIVPEDAAGGHSKLFQVGPESANGNQVLLVHGKA